MALNPPGDIVAFQASASTASLAGAMPPPPPLMRGIVVVFGASGDLAKRKTFPALYLLLKHGFLCPKSILVGFSRSPMTNDKFFSQITSMIKDDGEYQSQDSFVLLKNRILELKNNVNFNFGAEFPYIFYLAVPPSVFLGVANCIHKHIVPHLFLSPSSSNYRIVVEKPFGRDLDSSNVLSEGLAKLFEEHQLYRIDHYLGKEMVKNIMVLRFTNRMLETVWNSNDIANVQITFKETHGVEGRGGYFDAYGIIRDVMQNHLLQILSLVAMSRPATFSSDDIRNAKVAVLKAVRKIDPGSVVLGQYQRNGTSPGYTDDPTVPDASKTATFAALVMYIDVPVWKDVPFILKCGKGLNEQKTEIRIQFKELDPQVPRNELVIRVQPREAVYLKLNIKNPGLTIPGNMSLQSSGSSSPMDESENANPTAPTDPFISSELELTYGAKFTDARIPDAYESLLLDLLHGEQGNFVRRDELDAAWRIFTPLLEAIEDRDPIPYPFGSRGPKEADALIQKVGYKRNEDYVWHPSCL